ncbi:hypothetical protein TTHERM_00643400 (macronuclear) [Tetrahymena thermophila SB210]|uniref:Uncharacterized protein n=1 Tax=Tetrahymena thermophila (strain SB210) TaxID=312017 RepID=Q23EZ1_TETTS|nr:hypothetical protein TTHERM_00643400 [Tetrahymena thermophila SB210]EAR95114.1 hypothetical protein TTHERM_00643400 [Tetrahymena thermophila SB210]|eukprot:XP_001015359.1 hypothetical protein TTHERM_00643400 [Tetrahymena thermophila SB210]
MINRSLCKNESLSPINSTKQISQWKKFDFQNVQKFKVENLNKKLNSSISPRQEQSKTNQFYNNSNRSKIQSPQNKLNSSNQFQYCQSPKAQCPRFNDQKESQLIKQKFNQYKQNSFQLSSPQNKNNNKQQNLRDKYLINKTHEMNILESDSDTEEEVSIWQENQLQTNGVDTDQFVDCRGEKLDFYQIYRLRSALYQPTYVSRIDTIFEVQNLCQHFNKEITIEQLEQQQSYLDQYYEIQKKKKKMKDQKMEQLQNKQNVKNFTQKCQTERIYRPMSSQEQNKITSTKLKQQINQNQNNQIQREQNEFLQNQSERIQKQQYKDIQKSIDKKAKELNQSYKQLQQQYKSKRRQKISIDQEQAQKMMQNKMIPIKQISLLDDNDDDQNDETAKTDYSFYNASPKSNNRLSQSKDNKNSIKCQQSNINQKTIKISNQNGQQDFKETAKSVLSYLQKIVSIPANYGHQYFQSNKLHNLTEKFMRQQPNKGDQDNKLRN